MHAHFRRPASDAQEKVAVQISSNLIEADITTFALECEGGKAIALLGMDDRICAYALAETAALSQLHQAKGLAF